MRRLNVGLYGANGHQIAGVLAGHPRAVLAATAELPREALPAGLRDDRSVRHYATFEELLGDPAVELVSLCSPRRRQQADDAVRALRAGKHVYAEKPCAMAEPDLDRILAAAAQAGRQFHEMAGTAFEQPYWAMRQAVREGVIGDVVQVFAQKSYPYHPGRPQDEDVDGGLIGQNAIHAVRFIEHVAMTRVRTVEAIETRHGNPVAGGGLNMACSLMMRLGNGGVATVVANYLNQPGFGSWGNEHLRIFGTKGFVESVDAGRRTRLVVGDRDHGPLDTSQPAPAFFDLVVAAILDAAPMPFSLEEELHPTRVVIQAKAAALRNAPPCNP
ncbi:MAG: putative 4,5-dihydroxyphthalate dehydrogenase [Lentisphaerae bacterium ADurb.BinA184]|nr:MAG: putative 4,5-dihydroxyphthalate dehydrogenase [Lentisphaerae bacterium ADurb.BinA184]